MSTDPQRIAAYALNDYMSHLTRREAFVALESETGETIYVRPLTVVAISVGHGGRELSLLGGAVFYIKDTPENLQKLGIS